MPTATYRISYRPVFARVSYMPVVGIDPCSGCAVTTYRPTQTLNLSGLVAALSDLRVSATPPAVVGVGRCGSCGGCAPCSRRLIFLQLLVVRYRSIAAVRRAAQAYGGCSSCNAGVSSSYVTSGGCSSCGSSPSPSSSTTLPGPGDMSRPPAGDRRRRPLWPRRSSARPPGRQQSPPLRPKCPRPTFLRDRRPIAPGASGAWLLRALSTAFQPLARAAELPSR